MLDFEWVKEPQTKKLWIRTSLTGKPLLTTPQLNKGTAFSVAERSLFGLTGKLPALVETLESQVERCYLQYHSYKTSLQKNIFLNKLHDTNQVLFYKLVQNHEAEMLPILYTPTVGEAVQKFSLEFQQARGLYISFEDRYKIAEILDNRSNPMIDLIVASDGGGVLGIGDQGIGAMLIPVAKLMVYTICGGINPLRTLPILLDAGTDNETLLQDPLYLGWRHPRINGRQYDEFIDLFVQAVKRKFPDIFLHWEDFGRDNARRILQQYQKTLCSFNDDIQGTGATALAALLAAVKATQTSLIEQRIVIFGSGSAGTGIADQICEGLVRQGLSREAAYRRFWLIDRNGLLADDMTDLTTAQRPYARAAAEGLSGFSLQQVIEAIKPTVLIGSSARGGAFSQAAIQQMAQHVDRPIIFPLSNPTEKSEATPQDVLDWTSGKALIATGSPYPPVYFNGRLQPVAQCNNALVFPGIGLGVMAVKASQLTDNMLWVACESLNHCAPIHQNPHAALLPSLEDAHQAAYEIAVAVAKQAFEDGVARIASPENLESIIQELQWQPRYLPFQLSQ
ncbi:MAG: NAD-dependent malic enzyme [Gammaproteobacteria bacterium]